MLILEVNKKTLFVKFVDLYPECEFLIQDEPQLYPLICFNTSCHRNRNCMEKLVKRVKSIFDAFPEANLVLAYYKYRDAPTSIRAGVFWNDFSEPRIIRMNHSAWEKMKQLGTIYEWEMPREARLA